jgi:biopolymer transport protein ExbD
MSWRIRHEGSPKAMEGLALAQVVEGLQDGLWEPTDEVMGPGDNQWVAIESHPELAEVAADLEPPPPRHEEDETRLDMNPLIDVALVLLIFFILTASYQAMQKVLEAPSGTRKNMKGPLVKTKAEVKQVSIKVEIKQVNGKPVVLVEDEPVSEADLSAALARFVRDTRKTEIVLDVGPGVDWGTVIMVQDAARGAGVDKAHYLVKPAPENRP